MPEVVLSVGDNVLTIFLDNEDSVLLCYMVTGTEDVCVTMLPYQLVAILSPWPIALCMLSCLVVAIAVVIWA